MIWRGAHIMMPIMIYRNIYTHKAGYMHIVKQTENLFFRCPFSVSVLSTLLRTH